ncbi:ubiquitin-conjugating enzyme E2 T-like [Biomphalaria glabrata]|uniref:Ubiquitin-conjugating enzyme E2 T n=1 Tax=Biomphalaria glabrata TaxID=6526 RepID=A0A9W3BPK7_BIOGL|nr:ubiquitin-conjugating enzyme E2 T-like [Biomphalaria glabrata]
MNNINKSRIKKELEMFLSLPSSEIYCSALNDERLDNLSAQITGASGTPYEGGTFKLEIQIPDRYPFEPPRIRFITPIYHPNIDPDGRICMDTLKIPPKGTWRPFLNISTVLMMIRVLMGEPGSEDPLMTDIWQEFKYDYKTYAAKAKEWTRLYAVTESDSQHKNVKQPLEMRESNALRDASGSETRPTLKLKLSSKEVCNSSSDKTGVLESTQPPQGPVGTDNNTATKEVQGNQENWPAGNCPERKKRKLRLH